MPSEQGKSAVRGRRSQVASPKSQAQSAGAEVSGDRWRGYDLRMRPVTALVVVLLLALIVGAFLLQWSLAN